MGKNVLLASMDKRKSFDEIPFKIVKIIEKFTVFMILYRITQIRLRKFQTKVRKVLLV